MENKFAKVSDNIHFVELKRKRATSLETCFSGGMVTVGRHSATLNSSKNKSVKRRKLDGCRRKHEGFSCHSGKTLIRYYSNFMKTGLPERVMFYLSGEWIDFPKHTVAFVQKELQVKKAVFEVKVNGHLIMLDFLHMIQLDLESGSRKPIAWIDEAGSCFFPENFSDGEDLQDFCQNKFEKGEKAIGLHEIEVQLEIDIKGVDCSMFKESNGESNIYVEQIQIDQKADSNICNLNIENYADEILNKVTGQVEYNEKDQVAKIDIIQEKLDSRGVRNMFLLGADKFNNSVQILDICCGSGSSSQSRWELFQKQVEITHIHRGDANVRFAWLPSSKEAVSSVMMYGLGHCGASMMKSGYGAGVHLTAGNSSISANICDYDENGVQYLLLCRVVMGNMEVVHPGSNQFHPTSKEFDSGADDLENPTYFVVWDMNANTHIYPEYVVSFKIFSNVEGCVVEDVNKCDISGVTSQGPGGKLQSDSYPADLGNDSQSKSHEKGSYGKAVTMCPSPPHAPKSPWMPFPLLFEAISRELPSERMKKVNFYYDLFKCKKMTRDDFVKKLRLVVGDALLKSTITNVQCKTNPGNKMRAGDVVQSKREEVGDSGSIT